MFLAVKQGSKSGFELRGCHGKRPLFSRWSLIARGNVEAQSIILALSDMATGGE